MRHRAKITRWNDEKGYGHTTPVGNGQPVFVHVRDFERRSVRPRVGLEIEFELGSDRQGRCCATRVRVAGERAASSLRVNPALILLALGALAGLWGLVLAGVFPGVVALASTLLSVLAFAAYYFDKSAAIAGRRRTPERTLHGYALFGGWPGALLAQQFLRHKSSKSSFQTVFWLTVILNAGALAWMATESGASVRKLLAGLT